MKLFSFIALLLFPLSMLLFAQEPPPSAGSFYHQSLHYTNRGIEFVYSKEHGGLERLTGLSAAQMNCTLAKCHVSSCDECHKKEADGKASYTTDASQIHAACQKCHPVAPDDPDVHVVHGMKCMDCHTAREIHGDGTLHSTYNEPGFFDARCENCHDQIAKTASHTIHQGKLDCIPCHVLEMPTCINCHIDTRLVNGKDNSIQLNNMLFLVNHDGKVKLANFLSYVYGEKTMITLAPSFTHSVKKSGRTCGECHGSKIVQDLKKNKLTLMRWEGGAMKNVEGVIPVIEGMTWNLPWLSKSDGRWVPLKSAVKPLVNFSGYCSPLTAEQFDKLNRLPQSSAVESKTKPAVSRQITILYDNYAAAPEFEADWGFSCLITGMGKTILFDTGAKPEILLRNMEKLKIDIQTIDLIVISHMHHDHTGGLTAILERRKGLPVYLPASATEEAQKEIEKAGGRIVLCREPQTIMPGVDLTGEMGDAIREQSLFLTTSKGLIVITGCAHPDVAEIAARAKQLGKAPIYLLMGGFHLLQHSEDAVDRIIARFKEMGIERIGASHCTGDAAIERIKKAYGDAFQPLGVGRILNF